MKIKLSKASWLILSAGIFVVVLAGLGVTRSQQLQQQSKLDETLAMSESRLSKIEVTQLDQQLETLGKQVAEAEAQLSEAKDRLRQTVVSVDVTDKFFVIAGYSNVAVQNISNTAIQKTTLGGVGVSTMSVSARVTGAVEDIIDFVINLNSGFTTGVVKSATITVVSGDDEAGSSAAIQMVVHSYEEK